MSNQILGELALIVLAPHDKPGFDNENETITDANVKKILFNYQTSFIINFISQ